MLLQKCLSSGRRRIYLFHTFCDIDSNIETSEQFSGRVIVASAIGCVKTMTARMKLVMFRHVKCYAQHLRRYHSLSQPPAEAVRMTDIVRQVTRRLGQVEKVGSNMSMLEAATAN